MHTRRFPLLGSIQSCFCMAELPQGRPANSTGRAWMQCLCLEPLTVSPKISIATASPEPTWSHGVADEPVKKCRPGMGWSPEPTANIFSVTVLFAAWWFVKIYAKLLCRTLWLENYLDGLRVAGSDMCLLEGALNHKKINVSSSGRRLCPKGQKIVFILMLFHRATSSLLSTYAVLVFRQEFAVLFLIGNLRDLSGTYSMETSVSKPPRLLRHFEQELFGCLRQPILKVQTQAFHY